MTHIPADVNLRAYLLGLHPDRAKFLMSCPHTQNNWKDCEAVNVIVPYNPQAQIDEAKRIGLGAYDAGRILGVDPKQLLAAGFKTHTTFPKPAGNADYSLFQHETKAH